MKRTEHTPGPYHIGDTDDVATDEEAPEWRTAVKCDMYEVGAGYGLTADEAEANARLFTAAPDLLNTCIGILECLDEKDRWTSVSRRFAAEKLRAAIAKARGLQP